MRSVFILFFVIVFGSAHARTPAYVTFRWKGESVSAAEADSVKKGFRGLSVVNSKVIWISGQKGLVGRSTNGGRTFHWRRIKGFGKMDFRTLHAFDKKTAVIATAGTPAVILRTTNGGKNWVQCYRSDDSAMFFDGVGFWDDQHGLIFGDPINGRMFLMETASGGDYWYEIPFEDRPQLVEVEAAFAASGTTIRTLPGGHVYIATGGAKSRLWHSRDYGHHWEVFETPMIQGKPSQGIFSIAFKDTLNGVIVGGDYLFPNDSVNNCFFTTDGGRTWNAPSEGSFGYRSCVSWGSRGYIMIATGPGGTDISRDGGQRWRKFDPGGWNCIHVASTAPDVPIYFVGGATRPYVFGNIYREMENAFIEE